MRTRQCIWLPSPWFSSDLYRDPYTRHSALLRIPEDGLCGLNQTCAGSGWWQETVPFFPGQEERNKLPTETGSEECLKACVLVIGLGMLRIAQQQETYPCRTELKGWLGNSVTDSGGVLEMVKERVRESDDAFEWNVGSVPWDGTGIICGVACLLDSVCAWIEDKPPLIAACSASVTLVRRVRRMTLLVGGAFFRWEDKISRSRANKDGMLNTVEEEERKRFEEIRGTNSGGMMAEILFAISDIWGSKWRRAHTWSDGLKRSWQRDGLEGSEVQGEETR